MDRYLIRRPRLSGALPSEPSPSSARPESPVFEIHDETTQSQTQTQSSEAATFQRQSQTQRTGPLGDMTQTQTQMLSRTRSQTECREETADTDTQDQGPEDSDEASCCVVGDAESAPESQRRAKRARPSHTHGHSLQVRTFQAHWSQTFPWLEYHDSSGAAFCHICKFAFQHNCVTFASRCQMTFIQTGFTNWKKALERFRTHERSECHREAVLKTRALRSGVTVCTVMSKAHTAAKVESRQALLKILSSLRFLVRQGLAIRGHVDATSNFTNLLRLRCEDIPVLKTWMKRTSYKWCSHSVTNEMLEIMSLQVARSLVSRISAAKYFAVMVDETADISIQEQVSICFRIVTEDLEVEELFLGFHSAPNTKSETIFNIILDILRRFNLQVKHCRGQCFDGARNMAGALTGVQARMRAEEPRALFVHCMAHTLSLTVHDLVRQMPGCRNVLHLAQEIITYVRDSPKRHHLFKCFQSGAADGAPPTNLRPFCPTRWTVRCQSLSSILSNFRPLMELMEDLSESESSDAGFKAHGFYRIMKTFDFFFHLSLLSKVFGYVDSSNTALQKKSLHFHEATTTISTLSALLSDFSSQFESFWADLLATSRSLSLARPKVPRKRRLPCRFRDPASPDVPPPSTPKDHYRQAFSEVVDTILECVSSRFQAQPTALMAEAEQYLTGKETQLPPDLREHLKDAVDEERLRVHRDILLDVARTSKTPIDSIAAAVRFLREQRQFMSYVPEVLAFLRQLLTVPVSTSTAERSFSTLRRLKTYMRTTCTQTRLNHLALLAVHPDLAVEADLEAVADEFISRNEQRRAAFAYRT